MNKSAKYGIVAVLAVAMLILPGISSAQTSIFQQIQSQLQGILQQVQSLQTQLTQFLGLGGGGGASSSTSGSPTTEGEQTQTSATWCHDFNANLSVGSSGNDVAALQVALTKEGMNESDPSGTYGESTAAAVSGFQEKYKPDVLAPAGLQYGTGYVGPSTRAELNKLYGCSNTTNSTPAAPSSASNSQTYSSSAYGVSFSYPKSWSVSPQSVPLWQDLRVPLVNINTPINMYPGTDFEGASLSLSVDDQLSSGQCYALTSQPGPGGSGTQTIGGVSFGWTEGGGASAGTDQQVKSYSGYTNGICYEFNLGYVYSSGELGQPINGVTYTQVNGDDVMASLESALSSVVFTSPVPSSAANQPSLQILSPVGGEQWRVGQTYQIKWNASGFDSVGINTVSITLEDSNSFYPFGLVIATSTNASAGTYSWTIPAAMQYYGSEMIGIGGSKYSIRIGGGPLVEAKGAEKYTSESKFFSIASSTSAQPSTQSHPTITSFTVTPSNLYPNYQNVYLVHWAVSGASANQVQLDADCAAGLTISSIDDAGKLQVFRCGDLERSVAYGEGDEYLQFTNASGKSINEGITLSVTGAGSPTEYISIPAATNSQPSASPLLSVSLDPNTPSGNVPIGSNDVTLAKFDVTSGNEEAVVLFWNIGIEGTAVPGSASALSSELRNLAIYDNAGGQVGTTIISPPSGNACSTGSSGVSYLNSAGYYAYNDCLGTPTSQVGYWLPPNTTRILSLKADIPASAKPGFLTSFSLTGANNVKGMSSMQIGSTGNVTDGARITLINSN